MKNFLINDDIDEIVKSIQNEKSKFNNKNIIISGAFGFIGKYLLESLLLLKKLENFNINIYALDNFVTSDPSTKKYFEKKDVNCINHDINKNLEININFDYIICLAGIASPYYYNKYPIETLNVSINGLKNMFNLKHHKESKFIFFSSSEIYGDPPADQIPTSENYRGNVTPIGPRSCYDESKRVGETLCYIHSNYYKKNTAIIRPFNVYGPGMSINDYRIIPNITRSLIYNEQLSVYDSGNQTRTYCYVTDALNGFLKVVVKNEKFGVYNIGNDSGEISVLDLVKKTEKVMNEKINYKKTPYPAEYPPDEPNRRCPDLTNSKKNLNYFPKVSLDDGLKRHFDWAKNNLEN